MADFVPTENSPEVGAVDFSRTVPLAQIGSLSVYELPAGPIRYVGQFDAIIMPVDREGRAGNFFLALKRYNGELAGNINQALMANLNTGEALTMLSRAGAFRLANSSRPTIIAACSARSSDVEKDVMMAASSALDIATKLDLSHVLLPILGVGSGRRDPIAAARGMVGALRDTAYYTTNPTTIFITSDNPKALAALKTWLKALPASRSSTEPSIEQDARANSNVKKATKRVTKPVAIVKKERPRVVVEVKRKKPSASLENVITLRAAIRTSTAPGFRADSQGNSSVDMVGVGAEIQAFAKLAAFRDIPPPLAVGVFGDWGSGKSFFMAGVRRKIAEFAEAARTEIKAATDKGEAEPKTDFHANIVQIEFNAWHYIESNLWASLVEYIFSRLEEWLRRENEGAPDEVGALFDSLATSRQLKLETARQVMSANAELHDAQKAVAEAETARAEKAASKAVAAKAFLDEAMKGAFGDTTMKPIRDALAKAGLTDTTAQFAELSALGRKVGEEGGRSQLLWQSAQSLISQPLAWAAVLSLLIIPLIFPPLAEWVLTKINGGHVELSDLLTGASAVAATGAAWLKWFLGKVSPALDKVQQFASKVEAKKSELQKQALAAEDAALAEAQTALKAADEALAAAQERLTLASAQAAEAQNRYYSESARGRLNRFIRERLADGTYGKHLGLIATIRKDFDQLTNLIEGASQSSDERTRYDEEEQAYRLKVEALIAEAEKDGRALLSDADKDALVQAQTATTPPRTFERVILYIDDLDRCPPEKVVEVIQAVHMLLCFRLFVVFVAVDARWVTQALQVVFEKQLAVPGSSELTGTLAESAASNRATANDYMEKIFQIPYWVRPLQGKVASGFMSKMVEEFGINRPELPRGPALAQPTKSMTQAGGPEAVQTKAVTTGVVAEPATKTGATATPAPLEDALDSSGPGESIAKLEKLMLVEADLAALAALAPTVGDSPRRIKRFFNTYLLIQTIALVTVNGEASDIDPEARKDFEVLLTGCSFEQQTVALATSLALAMQGDGLKLNPKQLSALKEADIRKSPDKFWPVLRAYLAIRKEDPDKPEGLEAAFRLFLPIAQRYGFNDLGEAWQ